MECLKKNSEKMAQLLRAQDGVLNSLVLSDQQSRNRRSINILSQRKTSNIKFEKLEPENVWQKNEKL